MELKIGFECPQCRKITSHQLNTFRPGELHICSTCNTRTATLSDATLKDFAVNLRRYCEQRPPF